MGVRGFPLPRLAEPGAQSLDIRAGKRVSFRGTMDYNPVFIRDSGSDRRDLLRISLGVLFR